MADDEQDKKNVGRYVNCWSAFFGIKASAKCINVNAIAYAIFM